MSSDPEALAPLTFVLTGEAAIASAGYGNVVSASDVLDMVGSSQASSSAGILNCEHRIVDGHS